MTTEPVTGEDAPLDTAELEARSFGVACLVFLTVIGFVDWAIRDSAFSRKIDAGTWVSSKRPVLRKSHADVVVAGSSVIREGLHPASVVERVKEVTGRTVGVFNYGTNGGSFPSDLMVADALLEMPAADRPKLLVVSMGPMEFSCCPQVEVASSQKYITAVRPIDLLPFLRIAPTLEEAATEIAIVSFRSLAIRSYVINAVNDLTPPPPPDSWPPDGGGGTLPPVDSATQAQRAKGRAESFRSSMMKPKTVDRDMTAKYLRSIVTRLAAVGIRTALIGNPQAPQMFVLNGPDGIYPEYLAFIQELAHELGVTFTNFGGWEGLGADDFLDGDHLNHNGAVKYSKRLADTVVIPVLAQP